MLLCWWSACTAGVLSVAWQGDSKCVSASVDKTVQVCLFDAEVPFAVLRNHSDDVNVVACQATDDPWGASGSDDATVVVWDSGGGLRHTLTGHTSPVHWLQWAPKGSHAPDMLASYVTCLDCACWWWSGCVGVWMCRWCVCECVWGVLRA